MKMKNLLYYLSKNVCKFFLNLFLIDLFLMAILYLLGCNLNMILGYMFFLLLGLWVGSVIAVSAMLYMKKHPKK